MTEGGQGGRVWKIGRAEGERGKRGRWWADRRRPKTESESNKERNK